MELSQLPFVDINICPYLGDRVKRKTGSSYLAEQAFYKVYEPLVQQSPFVQIGFCLAQELIDDVKS